MNALVQVFRPGDFLALEARLAATVQGQQGALTEGQLLAAAGGNVQARAATTVARGKLQAREVGIVPLYGLLLNGFGAGTFATDVMAARRQVRELTAAGSVEAILLAVDSPGGTVVGTEELASAVLDARRVKPVFAAVSGMAASAAYWVAAGASRIYSTPSGSVGSIGVFATHQDISGAAEREGVKTTLIASTPAKIEGNPFGPLSTEAAAAIRKDVMAYHRTFVAQVAEGRRVSTATVESRYGQGRTVLAPDAAAVGMIDGTNTFEQTLAIARDMGSVGTVALQVLSAPRAEGADRSCLARNQATAVLARLRINPA